MSNKRRHTQVVNIGGILIGSGNPVAIQSMTNTPTRDIESTVSQIQELANAGTEIIRLTINDDDAAKALPYIYEKMVKLGIRTPLVGDFHYNGHILLNKYQEMAQILSKYRINPGNVGKGKTVDDNFFQIIDCAIKYGKPIRIGVNGGSIDQELLSKNMEENSTIKVPLSSEEVYINTMVESGIISAKKAIERGLEKDKIILSVKMSHLQSMISAYERISKLCDYPLHLGLTEAGGGIKGIVSSSSALAILLQQGIGDTIRVSLTPEIGQSRTQEVEVCKNILQSMGFRKFRPQIVSCPGCGRTSSNKFQFLAKYIEDRIKENMLIWRDKYKNFEDMSIAVMGCIVNGIGEAKNADIGIFIPGDFEKPQLQIYIKGEKYKTITSDDMITTGKIFFQDIEEYLDSNFKK